MGSYSEVETSYGDVRFDLYYSSEYLSYYRSISIVVDSGYVEQMRKFLDDLGLEKIEKEVGEWTINMIIIQEMISNMH